MAQGPSKAFRRAQAIEDRSHLITETWRCLGRNILLTVLVAITVWAFCATLLITVEHANEWLFGHFEHHANHLNDAPWILLAVLVGGGIVRDILLRFDVWKDAEGDGVAVSLSYFYDAYQKQLAGHDNPNDERYNKPTFMRAVRRVVLTFLTVGTGGSGGLEGPVIPVGEALGSGWSKYFKILSPDDLRIMQMAGISVAFSTLLSAPFMAAIFAAEVIFTDRIIYRPLFYSLLGAMIAVYLNNNFLHIDPLFSFHPHARVYHHMEYAYATLVAVLVSAPAALGLRFLFQHLKTLVHFIPLSLRATVGALITCGIALLLWFVWHIAPQHVLGSGESTLSAVYEGTQHAQLQIWWMLLIIIAAKAFATGFTLMAGGSAGLLIPSMFMGGMSGAVVYYLLQSLGIPMPVQGSEIFIVSGVASALVAVIETPLAAIAFVLEGFGAAFGAPAIVACVVCHFIVKRLHLYVDEPQN